MRWASPGNIVQMVGEIDRPDRKWIAGQPHQQHPFLLWYTSTAMRLWDVTSAAAKGA